jgi:hypothetical protein
MWRKRLDAAAVYLGVPLETSTIMLSVEVPPEL